MKKVFAGCGCLCLILAVIAGFFIFMAMPPLPSRSEINISVDHPEQISVGRDAVMKITLNNDHCDSLTVVAVCVDSSMELNFADGISVTRTAPPFTDSEVKTDCYYYYFSLPIERGDSRIIKLRLSPVQTGTFSAKIFVDLIEDGAFKYTPPVDVVISVN